jgi:Ca-activated chloride channel homolog
MKIYIIAILLLVGSVSAFGQKERKFIRQGNRLYKKAVENSDSTKIDSVNFAKAEIDYRKALDKKPGDFKSQYNIGNSLFKQKKWAESSSQYEQILESASKEEKGKAWFNYGNSMLAQQKLDESITAYKNALRNTPKDLEAKYNLEFARRMKQKQQQQQKNKDQNKDNKDQNKDQQKKDQNKQDQNKDQQKKDQQNKDQNQDKNQQQQQQPKISRQNAEQMLKALQNDERQTQEKVKKAEALKAKSSRPDQDW